MLGVFTSDA